MSERALIVGCEGLSLTAAEIGLFEEVNPWGLILFARNCGTPDQIRALVSQFRTAIGRDSAPVLVDQEGGRVQRLKPPHWRQYPPARVLGDLFQSDRSEAMRLTYVLTRLIARDVKEVGITVDCLPVLDVQQPGAHDVIGDRAYGREPEVVAVLGGVATGAMLDSGVLPVVKHVPGHGRAQADSHKDLPIVETSAQELRACDFVPFAALNTAPLAMTAHVVYSALDKEQPATLSKPVIDLIRGEIGYDGALMTDDLSMGALTGSLAARAEAALEAGCDLILHCNGDMSEMMEIAESVPVLTGDALRRCEAALARLGPPKEFDVEEALGDLDRVLVESV